MSFSAYFDCILNEKNGSFHIKIMISAAHMLGGMLLCERILKKCAKCEIWCILVIILIRLCIEIGFFKVISLYRTIWYMLMGFQAIFPMNKHEMQFCACWYIF